MTTATIITVLAIAWPIIVWGVRYDDSAICLLVRERRLMTWHIETLVIGAMSATLVVISRGDHLQWLAWAGAMWSHGSSSVGRRMYEAQARRSQNGVAPDVHCWRAQRHYSYRGRATFAAINLLLGWYGSLASIVFGVAYDQWREIYTSRRARRQAMPPPQTSQEIVDQLLAKYPPEP